MILKPCLSRWKNPDNHHSETKPTDSYNPIEKMPATKQRSFTHLAHEILAAKAADPSADTSEQEPEIGKSVYGLYNFTNRENKTIEMRDR